jgi:D-beta-D-heptose 7-phosphate kinase/D-beta-D-heptose 1-phosphate adenosyltransferase
MSQKIQIPFFDNAKVLVVGDLMLDRYWHGPTSRISPEAPVPVVRVDEIEERPGGAGNVALNIAMLGAQCTLLGLTGDDEAADALEKRLVSSGVNTKFVRMNENATITKLRVMSRHQQLIRLDFEDGFIDSDITELEKEFNDLLDQHDIVVCSDYGKGCLRNIQFFINMCKKKKIPVLVDPKGGDFNKYRGASLITPNLSEFEDVVGECRNDDELVSKANQLCKECDLKALLITRSEKGMTLLESGSDALHLPTHAREVYDVTGAGDTVISSLAAAMAAGQSAGQATAIANLAAGIVVGKLGTASVTVHELQHAVRDQMKLERGVTTADNLQELVQTCRQHGERVVMTNGCFDILHAGHVTYLEQARRLGDRLIVVVNDDASVKQLKGEERPVNVLERRMSVLAGLESVDWVVSFSEDTPENIICMIKPDVLVKGGDYRPEEIAGSGCVKDAGGEVVVLDFVEGCSTSKLIETIRDQI